MSHSLQQAEITAKRDIQAAHEFLLSDDSAIINNKLDIEMDRYDRVYLDSQDYNKIIKSYNW